MEIINKIKEGLHQDNNVYDQPDFTMRDNLNGVITDLGSGNFKWSNIKGNTLSFTIGSSDKYMAHVKIKDRLFILTLSTNTTTVKILEVVLTNNIGVITPLWTIANSYLNLSFTYPIRSIWGFYVNEDTQNIYWSDFNNGPRCINIANPPSVNKFIDYFPVIDKVYGRMSSSLISSGGNVLGGNVFFAWRFYTDDGYYTDWSALSNPVAITGSVTGNNYDKYQAFQGVAPDENTQKKITIELTDLDSDFDKIQVCAFYSNDLNIAIPGQIFYDGDLTGTAMTFDFLNSGSSGTVTIADLIATSLKIEKFKDSTIVKKQNVISCIEERAELDIETYIEADISVAKRDIPLDTAGYPAVLSSTVQSKALYGMNNALTDEVGHVLRRGQWYKAITQVVYNDGTGAKTITAGNLFFISASATATTYTSGDFKAIVVRKKYLLASGTTGGDINTDYDYEYEYLEDEFYDWKSQKVAKTYRSYPQGEKVRLGILFFDKTGRPFFVRHLRNTNITYGIGDTNIPKRNASNKMLTLSGWNVVGSDGYYDNVCASIQHLVVSDLDITDIKDLIGGFMIVRAPIIHQYIGMGLLLPTYLSTNDVYSYPSLYAYDTYSNNYYGCYDFYCPEDMFNLKGFVLQEGDEIENLTYLSPYCKTEAYTIGSGGANNFSGLGRREVTEEYNFYHKLVREITPATICVNGALALSHEILSVTKYVLGDDDIPINSQDGTKLYKSLCAGYNDGFNTHAGINCNHSVLMLDTTDNVNNVIGAFNTQNTKTNSAGLLCTVKRPNADPYGGYSDSSIANSLYVSTGHFQEVNDTILAAILKNGKYIFNDIDVFGGDTFVQLFDFKRTYGSYDLSNEKLSHSIIMPVESIINIGLREGDHIAKNRSYDPTYNMNGLRISTGNTVLEEFNYNDGYSSDNINDYYLPVPYNYKNNNKFGARIRFTPEKNYGEIIDNFRRFLTNDFIDLDPNNGDITNIRSYNDKLVYWQPDQVGYIPIKERALTQSSSGQSVQLGVGGIFERYDELRKNIGNSHQFGLVESPIGFHWYDSRRKIYFTITSNLQITEDSIIKGLDSFFQNSIPDNFEQYDNPFSTYGILGGYDAVSKMIYSTFILSTGNKTIGINMPLNKFIGFYQFYPLAYLEYKNHLFHVNPSLLTCYIHGTGTYMNFFGTQYHAYVTIVVKEPSNIAKIFDNFEIIASKNFFTKATYVNSEQTKTETICNYNIGSMVITNRDYNYLKKRWFGSFPKVSRERLNDGYLSVTFEIESPYLVELFEMKSIVRKNM